MDAIGVEAEANGHAEPAIAICKIEGCTQPALASRGRYALLCEGHKQTVIAGRLPKDNEIPSGRESGVTRLAGPDHNATFSNDAVDDILFMAPYQVRFRIEGVAPLIFHRYSEEAVEEKANAPKGSRAKKQDNVESYVYRDSNKHICCPGEYIRAAMIDTARYRQDPRSPRKSAKDLFKAAIIPITMLAPVIPAGKKGPTKDWDYLDKRRMKVQQSAVTRSRPSFEAGWTLEFAFEVALPEYVSPAVFREVLMLAGRVNGLADGRPTYGRFHVTHFEQTGYHGDV